MPTSLNLGILSFSVVHSSFGPLTSLSMGHRFFHAVGEFLASPAVLESCVLPSQWSFPEPISCSGPFDQALSVSGSVQTPAAGTCRLVLVAPWDIISPPSTSAAGLCCEMTLIIVFWPGGKTGVGVRGGEFPGP